MALDKKTATIRGRWPVDRISTTFLSFATDATIRFNRSPGGKRFLQFSS